MLNSFLHNYSVGLALAGRYERALEVVERELALAREFSIDFSIPHALLVKAQALLGLRRFRQAEDALTRAARAPNDYIRFVAAVFGARVPLYRGEVDKALTLLSQFDDAPSIPSMRAEFLATKALACAAIGRFDESSVASDEAQDVSNTIETEVLVAGARAIVALGQAPAEASDLAGEALRRALALGNLDGFVCAYRTAPRLLHAIASNKDLQAALEPVLVRANDLKLARRVGFGAKMSIWQLTNREKEVLLLITEGLTNKEIAARLYLAESTVKVHVRHVLRKLGVRRRADAAIRAVVAGD